MTSVVLDSSDVRRTLGRMTHEILEANSGVEDLVVIGVLRRGWPIAKRLAFNMTQVEGVTVPCGKLDISRYRDDRAGDGQPDESEIPFEVSGKRVLLVDEVIYTGRTVRAALDALRQFGRPARVQLAVLIDRGHRELPIRPDYTGRMIDTQPADHVKVLVAEIDGEDRVVIEREEV